MKFFTFIACCFLGAAAVYAFSIKQEGAAGVLVALLLGIIWEGTR